jgi:5-methylthioadenosine/S-adenosylhomocysteine deaminase
MANYSENMEMPKSFILSNAIIVPLSSAGEEPFRGSLVVEDGCIAWVGQNSLLPEKYAGLPREELAGQALLPGLVNAHLHSEAVIFRGLQENATLLEQYNLTGELNRLLKPEVIGLVRKLAYLECAQGGTTFALDHAFTELKEDLAKPFTYIGIRGGLTLSKDTPDELLHDLSANGILTFVGAPGEEDWSEEELKSYRRLQERRRFALYMHLAETTWRWQLARDRFGLSPVATLAQYKLLQENTVGVHGVWMDADDIAMLAESGASIINTPTAEMKLCDGVAPLTRMLSAGVKVGLGTDGALWNNGADMLLEAKTATLLHRLVNGAHSLSGEKALRLATIENAKCLGIDRQTGSLEAGKRADMFSINLKVPHLQPIYLGEVSNVVENIVQSGSGRDVVNVWVGGEKIIAGGHSTKIDEESLLADFGALAESLYASIAATINKAGGL